MNVKRQVVDEEQLYTRHFSSLSVRDLLEGRDTYHVHLAHKDNVIATAVGLYLIRHDDADAADHAKTPVAAKKRGSYEERTLDNSAVRPWSWPCVLVFVSEWQKLEDFGKHPEHMVPPFLYLEDGRIIPVCVVRARQANVAPTVIPPARLDSARLCGGSPIFCVAQGQRRAGSAGCIVTDGSDYFALTNKHVAGEAKREIEASLRGVGRTVGISAQTPAIGSRLFSEIYPGLGGRDTRTNVDSGLVRLADVNDWSPGIAGLGRLSPIVDFSAETAALDWIGAPVVAHGAISGDLTGEIRALFYRYKTVGGRDYVTDFLIGRRSTPDGHAARAAATDGAITQPGDSGTVWCVDRRGTPGGGLNPVALQWGGQKLTAGSDAKFTQFALASSLSVICRELEVELVTDWNTEHTQYWGAVGHFKIAQQACFHVTDPVLKQFLGDNLDNLSFTDDATLEGATHLKADSFVPLSDVPDIVWKTNVNHVDRSVTRPEENPNHFADMDLPGKSGQTLFEICGSPPTVDLKTWQDFWRTAPGPTDSVDRKGNPGKPQHGALPFRVWQVFSAMQGYAAKGDAPRFLCAAGILAHYVGDACQPLHCSQHSDGLNGARTGVHSTYEDNMVEKYSGPIASGLDSALEGKVDLLDVADGNAAAVEVVNLMRRCHDALPPETICASYNRVHGGHTSSTKSAAVLDAMWTDCGEGTIACIADGIRVLASLWEAAFQSASRKNAFQGKQEQDTLRKLYSDTKFLPSKHIEKLTPQDVPRGTPADR
jgi:hypothetical protein